MLSHAELPALAHTWPASSLPTVHDPPSAPEVPPVLLADPDEVERPPEVDDPLDRELLTAAELDELRDVDDVLLAVLREEVEELPDALRADVDREVRDDESPLPVVALEATPLEVVTEATAEAVLPKEAELPELAAAVLPELDPELCGPVELDPVGGALTQTLDVGSQTRPVGHPPLLQS